MFIYANNLSVPIEKHTVRELHVQGTDEDKALLERRYGKVKLRELMDNVLSEEYLTGLFYIIASLQSERTYTYVCTFVYLSSKP